MNTMKYRINCGRLFKGKWLASVKLKYGTTTTVWAYGKTKREALYELYMLLSDMYQNTVRMENREYGKNHRRPK